MSRLDLVKGKLIAKHSIRRGSTEVIAVTPDGGEVWMGYPEMGAVLAVNGRTGGACDDYRIPPAGPFDDVGRRPLRRHQ